jgi:multidrug efflux system membrane fusion protein
MLSIVTAACTRTSAAARNDDGGRRGRGGGGGAVPVVVSTVTQKDVPVEIEAIGNVEAFDTVSIKAQVSGQLMDVRFKEGDSVKAGDVLFQIDPRPFQAALDQAQANDVRNEALLKQAEANLARDTAQADYAHSEVDRFNRLFARGLLSREQADQSKASADATSATANADRAAIASAQAQVAAGKAAVETARLQRAYTSIRAPISGQTGNVAAKAGNLVTASATELTTLVQLEPALVTFAVPGVNLPDIKRYAAGHQLAVLATPQDQDRQQVAGTLAFMDNTVDSSTDTIKLKASFPNKDRRLWPGVFTRVVLRLTTVPNATVVPGEAVQTGQDGQFVFVVKRDQAVDMRPVTTGMRVDLEIVVEKGLRPGEVVVTEGQLRLEPGTRVVVGQGAAGRGGRGGRGQGQRTDRRAPPQ